MSTVTIKNESRVRVDIILDHPAFHTKAAGFKRATVRVASRGYTGSSVQDVRRTYHGTLTLMPGESAAGLHPAIENCMQVRTLLNARPRVLSLKPDAPKVPDAPRPVFLESPDPLPVEAPAEDVQEHRKRR